MKLSAILEPMIAAGVSGDVILATVKAFEEQQYDAIERRRASDRERQERRRHVTSRDVTVTHSSCVGVARVEDNLLPKKVTGQEESKKEASPTARSRGTRLPDDFEANLSDATSAGLSEAEARREALKFRDHWISQPGQRGVKLDWPATWRNWCRRAVETRPRRSTGPPPTERTVHDVLSDIIGKSNVPHPGPAFDGSFTRGDSSGTGGFVRLDAIAARRPS